MDNCHFNLRKARQADIEALSALCLRSKAWWGYDADFMARCVDELSLTSHDIATTDVMIAEAQGQLAGMAQISIENDKADLQRLFIDVPYMGKGCGKILFDWAVSHSQQRKCRVMTIEADPQAAAFYYHMGAVKVGDIPSGSIPNRYLPLLEIKLSSQCSS